MKKISVSLSGHQTSITIEDEFMSALREIATQRGLSITSIIKQIDNKRTPDTNLSSAVRVWILTEIKNKNVG